jgi:outer membrane protein
MGLRQHLTGAIVSTVLVSGLIIPVAAQQKPLPTPSPEPIEGRWNRITNPYKDREVAPVSFANTSRIDRLMRAGNLYLTLNDAITLALENNLDIELQRFGPRIADMDLLRAQAGGLLRGFTLSVREGPNGVGGPSTGQTGGINVSQSQPVDTNLSINTQNGLSTGPLVPSLDPAIVGDLTWNRHTTPQASSFVTGTNESISKITFGDLSLRKGFLTGGTFSAGYTENRSNVNSLRTDYNPSTTANLALNFTQPLLRGFGIALNNRFIRIARNNRHVSDLAFTQQLISTVSATVRLYWDLVSLNEDVKVKQQSLDLSQKLLQNNQQQVEAGTLAPIEIVRARAEVARSNRDLLVSQTLVRQQETVLKDYLTRNTVVDRGIANVHVIPTDAIQVPVNEPVEPVQDMIARAFANRPDLAQARIQLENSNISLKGSKNALLPELDLVASAQNNALYGQVNSLPPPGVTTVGGTTGTTPFVRTPDPVFLGGFGTGLAQIFGRHFPDYGIGISLNIPIGNRAAIADLIRDKLNVRQQDIRLKQLEKQVQVEIENALIAVQQARATYEASQQARVLQEQALQAEQEKLSVGLSTSYLVIQYERDLALARSQEVASLGDYVKARSALDRAMGTILNTYNVSVEDTYLNRLP